ncbi:MAG: hypothetical protein QOJ73_6444 [Streptosporangiaceae bacterium]|nr:hypothetical protein [Streptosporangiaceae bacterium]
MRAIFAFGPGRARTDFAADPVRPPESMRPRLRVIASRPVRVHLAVLAAYIVAGSVVSWPRVTYLAAHELPYSRDAGSYVWGFAWVAKQVEHLSNPWFTRDIAAPVGVQLGYHALMPLEGVLMMPVTVILGPSASYNLLSVLMPGLLCYAMYRVGRLWLPSQLGAIAAGAFFGLSTMLVWRSWYHLNLAAGVLFIPLALEAAVRLRRRPGWRQAVILGVVMAGALLTDQEMDILVIIVVVTALLPWLLLGPARASRPAQAAAAEAATAAERAGRFLRALAARAWPVALAGVVFAAFASPQIIAIVQQTRTGGASPPPAALAGDYINSGVPFPNMFALSPRVYQFGLHGLAFITYHGGLGDGIADFGLAVTALALTGLVISWRRRNARLLAGLWLGCTVLAVGTTLKIGNLVFVPAPELWSGVRLSAIMPYSWFIRVPGMEGFREAARITMLGMAPAALLAGSGVEWLRDNAPRVLALALILVVLEAGWAGNYDVGSGSGIGTMPTSLPALDRPIAADHSASIVADVPFGIRNGLLLDGEGQPFNPEAQVLATADGHPRAVVFVSRMPIPTLGRIVSEPFYAGLIRAECKPPQNASQQVCRDVPSATLPAARRSARQMDVGWVLLWPGTPRTVLPYLRETGFTFDYQADGTRVYRPARPSGRPASAAGQAGS